VHMSNHNLFCDFEASFRAAGDRTAIASADGNQLLSYHDLLSGAARYANALAALGVQPGDRVTVQIEKSIANVLLSLGVMKAGGVYQPLNTAYTESEVDYFIGDAEPKLIVCDPARQQSMRKLADRHKIFAVVNLDARGEGSLSAMAAQMDDRHPTAPRLCRKMRWPSSEYACRGPGGAAQAGDPPITREQSGDPSARSRRIGSHVRYSGCRVDEPGDVVFKGLMEMDYARARAHPLSPQGISRRSSSCSGPIVGPGTFELGSDPILEGLGRAARRNSRHGMTLKICACRTLQSARITGN